MHLPQGEKLMGTDTGRSVTFTVSLGVQECEYKVVSSNFDFITNQNTSHSMAPQVHTIFTLRGKKRGLGLGLFLNWVSVQL